jgi:hypothetical protein
MIGWVTVTVECFECGHIWSDSLPVEWDGTPPMCKYCGELASVEIAK